MGLPYQPMITSIIILINIVIVLPMVHRAASSANLQNRNRGACSLSPYTVQVIVIIIRNKKQEIRNQK